MLLRWCVVVVFSCRFCLKCFVIYVGFIIFALILDVNRLLRF